MSDPFDRARAEAQALVDDASDRATRILSDAHQDAVALRAQAKEGLRDWRKRHILSWTWLCLGAGLAVGLVLGFWLEKL